MNNGYTNGAIAPLALETLVAALSAPSAHQSTQETISAATNYVDKHSKTTEFLPFILRILFAPDGGSQVRFQAAILLKNGLDRWWRRLSPVKANDATKKECRSTMIRVLAQGEHNDAIRRTIALTVGKVGRMDFKEDWPDVFESLLTPIKAAMMNPTDPTNSIILHGCISAFHQIIKQMSTNRLPRGRVLLRQTTDAHFGTILEFHVRCFDSWTLRLSSEGLPPAPTSVPIDLELSRISLKILGNMAIYGFEGSKQLERLTTFMIQSLHRLAALSDLRTSLLRVAPEVTAPHETLIKSVTRHLLRYGKIFEELFSHDAKAVYALEGWTELMLTTCWTIVEKASAEVTDVSESPFALHHERLVVQCLNLIHSALASWSTARPSVSNNLPRVQHYVLTTIKKLLPLRQKDLELWAENPEEYDGEEAADRWQYDLRPCAERFVRDLVVAFGEPMQAIIMDLWDQARGWRATNRDMESILAMDAIYTVVGLLSSRLISSDDGPKLDVTECLKSVLLPESHTTDPNGRIIRRRVAVMLGQWVGESIPFEARELIYQGIGHLLASHEHNDLAVRLAAGTSLLACDTWDTDLSAFRPLIPVAMKQVPELIGLVESSGTQMRLTLTLGTVIDRAGGEILPWAPQLVEQLSSLWASVSDGQDQVSILTVMEKLVTALGPESQAIHGSACQLIAVAASPQNPSHLYLQDDALLLWLSTSRQATRMSPELLALFPLLVSLLEDGSDSLRPALILLQQYLLIDAAAVVPRHGIEICTALGNILHTTVELRPTTSVLESVVRLVKTASPHMWKPIMDVTGLITSMFSALLSNEPQTLVVTKYLCALSHIVVADTASFLQLLESAAPRMPSQTLTPLDLLDQFLSQCIDKMDCIGAIQDRKAVASALAYLTSVPTPVVLSKLTSFVSTWSSQLAERDEEQESLARVFYYANEQENYDEEFGSGTPTVADENRERVLRESDPLRNQRQTDIISLKLEEARQSNGEMFAQAWAAVDPLLTSELGKRLEGQLKG